MYYSTIKISSTSLRMKLAHFKVTASVNTPKISMQRRECWTESEVAKYFCERLGFHHMIPIIKISLFDGKAVLPPIIYL